MVMKYRLMCILFAAALATSGQAAGLDIAPGPSLHRLTLHDAAADHLNFVVYLPPEEAPHAGWPLILFLHGSEQRGDNPSLLMNLPILTFARKVGGFPFVTVVPQCPRGLLWSPDTLKQLLAAVEDLISVDKDRVYLTGFSMGGYGTWQTAAALPGVFAAIAPLCGMSDLPDAPRLADVPVWAFHGARDANVPLSESQKMIGALRDEGNSARLTVYPDLAHDCWTTTYNDSRLYLWFLSHSRADYVSVSGSDATTQDRS
jgi:predicted peptidase